MKHTEILPKIHLLEFRNQKDAAKTMLRFQEHYESPQFAGKIFTLNEYKKWYIQNSPNGKATGKFTYYSDWNGYNFPDKTVKSFRDGKFHPLTRRELRVLNALREATGKFYVIGTHALAPKALEHEIAHALFYTNPKYKKRVLEVLAKNPCTKIRKKLIEIGYADKVLDDELQAYCVNGSKHFDLPVKVAKAIRKIYDEMVPTTNS